MYNIPGPVRKQVSSSELKLRFVPVNFRAIVSLFFPEPPRDQQLVASFRHLLPSRLFRVVHLFTFAPYCEPY